MDLQLALTLAATFGIMAYAVWDLIILPIVGADDE